MTRSSGPKWPCCRRMDRRTPTRTRTPSIEHRTHPSDDLDPPSLLPPPPFIPCGLPPSLLLYLCRHSICQLRARKADFGLQSRGREWRLRRASQGGDTGEANTSPAPSFRSLGACCLRAPKSQLSVALCGAKDLRGMHCRAGPRVREDCWKEGRVGWRRCTL